MPASAARAASTRAASPGPGRAQCGEQPGDALTLLRRQADLAGRIAVQQHPGRVPGAAGPELFQQPRHRLRVVQAGLPGGPARQALGCRGGPGRAQRS